MSPTTTMALLPFLAILVGYICGRLYVRICLKRVADRESKPVIVFAGVLVGGFSAVLFLVLFPMVVPTAGAGVSVQFSVESPAMMMWQLRYQVFTLMLFVVPFVLLMLIALIMSLALHKKFMLVCLLLVPVVMYLLTMAAIFFLNSSFIPTA